MTPTNPGTPNATSDTIGIASNKHQGLRQPADDQWVERTLDNTGLEDGGEMMEDHLRDRRSKGVSGGYDDSIDHQLSEADQHDTARSAKRPSPSQR